ncbi:hypothetical protein R1flu_011571 [Riccia fluitans]|uniref:Uncharacterized protein n=1 Tax=Riccia fluitans TaxID=41844 RepID=A0ABD1ZAS1_9MARC
MRLSVAEAIQFTCDCRRLKPVVRRATNLQPHEAAVQPPVDGRSWQPPACGNRMKSFSGDFHSERPGMYSACSVEKERAKRSRNAFQICTRLGYPLYFGSPIANLSMVCMDCTSDDVVALPLSQNRGHEKRSLTKVSRIPVPTRNVNPSVFIT